MKRFLLGSLLLTLLSAGPGEVRASRPNPGKEDSPTGYEIRVKLHNYPDSLNHFLRLGRYYWSGRYLVDTAGVRRKQKVKEDIEFYSVMRSIRAIENSDVCVLMLDASAGLESQDLNLFGLCRRNNKGVVVVVNKWDLIEKGNNTLKEFEAGILSRLAPDNDIPVVFTSVINKQRIYRVMERVKEVFDNRSRRIPTSELNGQLLPILKQTPPPIHKGKIVKIKYVTQLPTPYPAFVFFCNLPQYVKEPYKRFVENQLRSLWDFTGVPVKVYFREK